MLFIIASPSVLLARASSYSPIRMRLGARQQPHFYWCQYWQSRQSKAIGLWSYTGPLPFRGVRAHRIRSMCDWRSARFRTSAARTMLRSCLWLGLLSSRRSFYCRTSDGCKRPVSAAGRTFECPAQCTGGGRKLAALRHLGSHLHPAAFTASHNDKSTAEYGCPKTLSLRPPESQSATPDVRNTHATRVLHINSKTGSD
jgi:hypothetical protein